MRMFKLERLYLAKMDTNEIITVVILTIWVSETAFSKEKSYVNGFLGCTGTRTTTVRGAN